MTVQTDKLVALCAKSTNSRRRLQYFEKTPTHFEMTITEFQNDVYIQGLKYTLISNA